MEQDDFASTWSAYVRRQLDAHRGDLTLEQIGDLIGGSGNMVSNWIKAQGFKQPSGSNVYAFWKQFGEGTTLPEAMSAGGYGSVEEYDTVIRTVPDPDLIETDDLFEALRKRTENPFSGAGGIRGVMTKTPQTVQQPASLREARVARAQRNPSL